VALLFVCSPEALPVPRLLQNVTVCFVGPRSLALVPAFLSPQTARLFCPVPRSLPLAANTLLTSRGFFFTLSSTCDPWVTSSGRPISERNHPGRTQNFLPPKRSFLILAKSPALLHSGGCGTSFLPSLFFWSGWYHPGIPSLMNRRPLATISAVGQPSCTTTIRSTCPAYSERI